MKLKLSKARKIAKLKRKLAKTKSLSFIQKRIMQKSLWKFNYTSVAKASFIGMFWMMIPIPFQMVPAIIMCIYFRANIPLAVFCVWISNPFTWLPIFFANYLFGCYLLGMNVNVVEWHSYAEYMIHNIAHFWKPLYLGSIVGGLILGAVCCSIIYGIKFLKLKTESSSC
jgi:hypothetical protein